MIRVLFVARYRTPAMHRKVEEIASTPDIRVLQICPNSWNDGFVRVQEQAAGVEEILRRVPTPMLGDPTDPHRAVYGALTFGLRAFRPHIIHAEEEPDSLAALQIVLARRLFAPRAKLILHTWQNLDRPKGLHVRTVMRVTLGAADAVFCANREAAELLQTWRYTRPTPILPAVGVDTETFRPCPPQANGFHVGFVGRLVPEKGVDTLLEALALLLHREPTMHVTATLVGAGPEEEKLREQVVRLHLEEQVSFAGPMPPEDVALRLCKFSALVLPSRTTPVWKEQLGRVLLEAMAAGVPVIGSDSGAIPEVIDDAGLVFPEGDAAALADCLAKLAGDRALRADLRRRGLSRAREYSQAELAHRTVAFYRTLLT